MMAMLNILIAQCVNVWRVNRLTNNSADDYWGYYSFFYIPTIFDERTPQSLYIVGDTVHILWAREGFGDRYNRSRDRGETWDWCTGTDCDGVRVLDYFLESSIVAKSSKVHAIAKCWDCSPSSWVPYNRSLDNGSTWDYTSPGRNIFSASEYGSDTLDSPAMATTESGDTILLVVDAYSKGIRVKRSFDGGDTWGPPGGIAITYPSYSGERHPQIAFNGVNKFFVCYTDSPYVKVTYTTDYGNTWSSPINIDTLSTNLYYNSCHISADGDFVSVVWFDDKVGAINVYYRESVDGGLTWRQKVNITGLTSSSYRAAGPMVVNHGDITYITWFERSPRTGNNYEIMVTCRPHPDSSWRPIQRLTSTSGRSLWPMMAYNWAEGWGMICWQDNTPGNYEIYCATVIPLLGDTTIGYEEKPIGKKPQPFTIKGNTLVLNGKYILFDVSGRVKAEGEGGSLRLKRGIYFLRINDEIHRVIIR